MSGAQRLAHLLSLADQGPAMRDALAEEVAELLTDWPADCPSEMRGPCETLLARAASEVNEDTRARLRVRLCRDPRMASRILPREAPDHCLIEAARDGRQIAPCMARSLGVARPLAEQILADETGHSLAVACKAVGLGRAVFSTLATLTLANPAQPAGDIAAAYARLDVWGAVPAAEAARQMHAWQSIRRGAE